MKYKIELMLIAVLSVILIVSLYFMQTPEDKTIINNTYTPYDPTFGRGGVGSPYNPDLSAPTQLINVGEI
jgi:hypothetical protein